MLASCIADSTSASGVGDPYFSSSSFSSDPALTPIRIGTPRAFASRAISRTLSWYLMLPGLIRRPWMPASSAAIAYFHWKWMSATTGIVACSAICRSASASSQCGTATRTISQPVATSAAICWSVALTSAVFVVVIDWTDTGASPPTSTEPTRIFRVALRFASISSSFPRAGSFAEVASFAEDVEDDRAFFWLVHLEQDQPLPATEGRISRAHGDRVRRRRQQHRLHVRVAVLALVGLLEVLRAEVVVVVGVVDLLRHGRLHPGAEIGEGAVLPLVDQERAGRVRAERDRRPVRHPRVLDRALQVFREVEVGVALRRGDLDRRRARLHSDLPWSAGATGSSNKNTLPAPGSLSAQIRPPWASTTDRAMARPIPVPPSFRERAVSTR